MDNLVKSDKVKRFSSGRPNKIVRDIQIVHKFDGVDKSLPYKQHCVVFFKGVFNLYYKNI